ncbi:MAG: hypothetical protein ACFFCV_15560 [Promethearchaeota archaeon]
MAITEAKNKVNINTSKVEFICPVCKSKKLMDVPNSVIAEAKQLTTMSIARGLVCDHQFQAFVDKNFQVRGYQRVDFELESKEKNQTQSNLHHHINDEKELFENLILEGNYLEYALKGSIKNKKIFIDKQKNSSNIKEMTLEEIYYEFREFIDKNNENFRDFINQDLRQNELQLTY